MITQKAKYALRALTLLARAEPGEPIQIPDIADKQKIPKKFLEQILLELKRAEWAEWHAHVTDWERARYADA